MLPSWIKTAKESLLALPPEIRSKIYIMVITNNPKIPAWGRCPAGELSLCQPALAHVNRQLRYDILPIWYREKSFGIRTQEAFRGRSGLAELPRPLQGPHRNFLRTAEI
ncbi:hypothetical protein diail_1554 [Diaporthe ilicicola]|nr:hypothetical protein diail_1554 [Diaporthe ilicicola]